MAARYLGIPGTSPCPSRVVRAGIVCVPQSFRAQTPSPMAVTHVDPAIRNALAADAPAVARLYNHFVTHTTVSFEEVPVPDAVMAARIAEVQSVPLPWLVAECDGALAGYAYATRWRVRSAYRYAVEVSVYVDPACSRRGIGSRLYAALFAELRGLGMHTAIGGIVLPNLASVALHEKHGFRKVAHFSEVGFKFDRWIDVGYWQRAL